MNPDRRMKPANAKLTMSTIDVHSWQRLAPMSLLFLIINGSARFIRENLYAFAGAGAGFAFLDRLGLREFVLGGAVALLVAVLIAMLYYRRFRFRIEGDALRLRRGIIENKDLRVRFGRVQNVGLSQPFYFRPFGLVRFTLETPGAESTEVALPGISRELAQALRDRIAQAGGATVDSDTATDAQDGDSSTSAETHESDLLHAPAAGALFAHGLVSNQVWLIAGLAAWGFGTLWERIEQWIGSIGLDVVLQRALAFGWIAGVVLIGGLVLFLFALSGLLSLLRYQDFALQDMGDRLLARGGMLDKREQTIRREKLTGLTLYQTALGRLLRQWYLIGKQASSKELEVDPTGSHFVIPGLRRPDLIVLERLLPGFSMPAAFHRISPRFRRFFGTRTALAIVVIGGVLAGLRPEWLLWTVGGAALALVGALLLIHRSFVCWGWQLESGVCWIQQGVFGLRQDAFRLDLVQQAGLVQSPYQRRHGLASVQFVLPHGQLTIPYLPVDAAAELVNGALLAAETARAHRL
jgi:putative membrane protein